ncbi:hypothetical protein Poli38472_008694 [Pythium oligandrum]|uniref:AB hydrolase-1 domain-containing protein n=1 Tax=Pythium oligandrum TaxID=41045 RepID=A0A8K1C3W8_PYTOL|nr:hypothetical protein Poli38472_008694 [Pythium oligandrum]|eukprot:TMW56046.1 hypothetical protein Poli38472_008694 [Pythium oligandrum]
MERTVLLFCHAVSLNGTAWNPIIRRVASSPLLQRFPCEIVTFDYRYHGANHDFSDLGKISFLNGDKKAPRADHDLRLWTSWGAEELEIIVGRLRADDDKLSRKTRIIGIGHSLGASSLIKLEILRPGLLDGIIAFEPVCNCEFMPVDANALITMMVANTLRKQDKWNTWDEVLQHFSSAKHYSRWDKEAIAAFLESGVIQAPDGSYRLACPPSQEAAAYCHTMLRFTEEDHQRMRCKVFYEHGEHTKLFSPEITLDITKSVRDKVIVAPAVKDAGHLITVENPAACAERILADLREFPAFQSNRVTSRM